MPEVGIGLGSPFWLTSILSILSLIQLRHEDAVGQVISVAWALLGVFFLYWLNTGSVREFFKPVYLP